MGSTTVSIFIALTPLLALLEVLAVCDEEGVHRHGVQHRTDRVNEDRLKNDNNNF